MADDVNGFVRALSREERLLLKVRDTLYEGSWDELKADLEARLKGKPFIVKLSSRIEEDLERIHRLRTFEQEHKVDLGPLVDRTA